MLALWLITCAVAASPQLHSLLHKDAQTPQHYCLFTQLSQHSVTVGSGIVLAPDPAPLVGKGVRLTESGILPSFDFVVSDGRAPPFNPPQPRSLG
jgi:hypothetical protein